MTYEEAVAARRRARLTSDDTGLTGCAVLAGTGCTLLLLKLAWIALVVFVLIKVFMWAVG